TGGSGKIVLGRAVATNGTPTLTLASGTGGIDLSGPIDLVGGDLILDSQSSVTFAANASIKARGLVLLGENVDYKLTHADNAVSVLAGNARSIRYEQAESLTIGRVGGIEGLKAVETVEVASRDGQLTVAAVVDAGGDVALQGDGVVVDARGSVEGASVTLQAGSGGMALDGQWRATATVSLQSTGTVNQGGNSGISAVGLALVGTGSFDLRGAGNAVQTVAGNAGSIHYQQSGSLTIGTVGTTSGLLANDRVQVVLTGNESDLTVVQGVSAHGSGYAIVLAAGKRFVNT